MASIVIVGGTGYAGGHIAREALTRGHRVASYSRSAPVEPAAGIDHRTGSLADPSTVTAAVRDADELVVAVHAADVDGRPLVEVLPQLIEAAEGADVRLSFVGGAGSSLVAPDGPRLVDAPDFQDAWKPEALAHADVLAGLRKHTGALRWFYVSPAAVFGAWAPGEALGSYRTGGDVLVTKPDGTSEISGADLAVAYVDEIERVAHPQQRFTVGH